MQAYAVAKTNDDVRLIATLYGYRIADIIANDWAWLTLTGESSRNDWMLFRSLLLHPCATAPIVEAVVRKLALRSAGRRAALAAMNASLSRLQDDATPGRATLMTTYCDPETHVVPTGNNAQLHPHVAAFLDAAGLSLPDRALSRLVDATGMPCVLSQGRGKTPPDECLRIVGGRNPNDTCGHAAAFMKTLEGAGIQLCDVLPADGVVALIATVHGVRQHVDMSQHTMMPGDGSQAINRMDASGFVGVSIPGPSGLTLVPGGGSVPTAKRVFDVGIEPFPKPVQPRIHRVNMRNVHPVPPADSIFTREAVERMIRVECVDRRDLTRTRIQRCFHCVNRAPRGAFVDVQTPIRLPWFSLECGTCLCGIWAAVGRYWCGACCTRRNQSICYAATYTKLYAPNNV